MKPPEGMKIELLPMDETDRVRNEVRCKVTVERRVLSDAELDRLVEDAQVIVASADGYRPFDQDDMLGESTPWPTVLVDAWEAAHGHDPRLKCYAEYGCQLLEVEGASVVLSLVAALKEARADNERLAKINHDFIATPIGDWHDLTSDLEALRAERDVVVARLTAIQALVDNEARTMPPDARLTDVGHEARRWVDRIRSLLVAPSDYVVTSHGSCNVSPSLKSQWRNEPHWHVIWPEGGHWCYQTEADAHARFNELVDLRTALGDAS